MANTNLNPDDVEDVTAADVEAAERETAEAEELVASLEQSVVEGDDTVTPERITEQASLARFAKLRLTAVRKKAERARAARRLRAAVELHDEINAQESKIPAKLAEKLRAIATEDEFLALADEHNRTVNGWRSRAESLGIPESNGGTDSAEGGRTPRARRIGCVPPNRQQDGLRDRR